MIATGNEDGRTWAKMLTLLKEACPIICERQTKFFLISDRDKGLKEAMKEVFPNVLEMSCARHIQQNVSTRYGKACGKYVMAMAKTYSVLYYNTLLEQMRTTKVSAAYYIVNMTNNADGEPLKTLWSNCQWNRTPKKDLPNDPLPPRFGIVTSNTAESVNSMFNAARNLPWMDAVETMIDVMIRRNCVCRRKYAGEDSYQSVPWVQRLIKSRWKGTASVSVLELEHECGVYQATTCDSGGGGNEDEEEDSDDSNKQIPKQNKKRRKTESVSLQYRTIHVVRPEVMWCSCGVWQDTLLPCRHACAVYRKSKSADENYILANLVHEYYTHGCVQAMFQKNIYPVSMDTVTYDGETNPPRVSEKRSAGRPRMKRLNPRSKYEEAEDSPIVCSKCGKAGHNKRTCSAKEIAATKTESAILDDAAATLATTAATLATVT